jgi:hypothetical protein
MVEEECEPFLSIINGIDYVQYVNIFHLVRAILHPRLLTWLHF